MSKKKPLLVGISGGIGAGKTLISKIFSLLNVPIYNADDRAKWLMAYHQTLKNNISKEFGEESYAQDGELNRSYLANIVFADPVKTSRINELVHPVVGEDFKQWVDRQEAVYILKEAALLFETGSYKSLDATIHVTASASIRTERVKARDPQRSTAQIKQIIQKQLTDKEKNKLADFLVTNDESILVIPQVIKIHAQLLAMAK
ncbi:MAG: dephospho-CoA kinase [Cytophagales bacterium]|uniref:dephospho-CoA kinase n=1 Tax=Cyclobacterium marinum TaxID=104 RepID=UPI0030D7AE0E|nr:dephospho-CoA kinase [Cytophagales bacterium]|tara:strand:+ start:60953 stop:61561 length:609 start_codon:yes stop_codon:yes gene_type:complete